ncbi:hypothetical protein [Cellulomonas xylanilytica]|uniref:Uncharacterized protein n=1 Tax=Cellulomonas xylanilytica TaxID=233583 RepID=A0A510V570_9CELL|nr:hypothetical protein [Cellulomonas xylanilytica]GEK21071.1 hypothetical protein CXY01_15910 [Cellulomonas xylanilytica]
MTTTDLPTGPALGTATETLVLPGAGVLELERDGSSGVLVALRGGGRDYLTVARDGVRTWHGVCTVADRIGEGSLLRDVRPVTAASFTEEYRWTGDDLTLVDGVEVRRDAVGRVVACLPGGASHADRAPSTHRWFYTHDDRGLVEVRGPGVGRRLALGPDGRVRAVLTETGTTAPAYDARGHRTAATRPARDHVDAEGRTWVVRDGSGGVRAVYLWDGMRCLARIDGPLGAPTAAVFSLDPSGTPVRVVGPGGVTRIPRDAYGEGLLAHPGVPGLFGGFVHAGLVHLPLRRLDPATGTFCEPDPLDGGDADPRRPDGFEGPLPVEREPRSAYEVCRGDPVGRSDPTGGVSAGLVLSTLTWSFQNNILSFFGIDWWFNLFLSLIVAPFKGVGGGIDYDFFSSTGLSSTDRLGSFGVRRDGFMNVITGGRAFTTQHIVWSPDSEFALLERGEVVDPRGRYEPTHYGTVLALAPTGAATSFLACGPTDAPWLPGTLPAWSRHGGPGEAVAPGTLTPWFPSGGLHLDAPRMDTRRDVQSTLTELRAGAVAIGDFEVRTVLAASAPTGLAAGALVLVDDGTALAMATVVAVVASGGGERLQLAENLALTGTPLRVTPLAAAPASSEPRPAGGPADSLDARGTTTTYAAGDLLRLTASTGEVLVARVARLEARLPLERPLPAGTAAPLSVATGTLAAATTVTAAGTTLDFGAAPPPGPGSTGVLEGGTVTGVRVEGPATGSTVAIDVAAPAGTTAFRTVVSGTVLGARADAVEADPALTYTPVTAGSAPDGSSGVVVVRVDGGGVSHVRVVPGAPAHDVVVVDRPLVGTGPWTTERWTTTGPAITPVTRADVLGIVVPQPERFEGASIMLAQVEAATRAVLLTAVDVAAGVVDLAPPVVRAGLRAGAPVEVGTEVSTIRALRSQVSFTPAQDLAATGLRLVPLGATGYAYDATVAAGGTVDVQAAVTVGGAAVAAPFLRVATNDLVRVRAGGTDTWHRVLGESAGRLTLTDTAALPAAGTAVTVRQVEVTDPGTGGPFLGVDGTRDGTGATGTATFSLWSSEHLDVPGTVVGIVDGAVTHPATITAAAAVSQVTFSTPVTATGVSVATFTHDGAELLTALARDGGVLLAEAPPGTTLTLATAADRDILVVALEPVGDARTVTLGPGTLLVPDEETTEIDRSQSLTNHELTHTVQYARWGPLWFNAFPMIVLELPAILTSDTELPEFSQFLDATVATGTGSTWAVTIPQRAGVAIAAGDTLQVVQGARIVETTVASVAGDVFQVRVPSGTLPTGRVATRKKQRSAGWDVSIAIMDALTHGGLVNLVAGSTWGGIFWLVGKAFYGLGRAMVGTGDLFAATVGAGGGSLTLTAAADAEKLPASGRVTVRQGEDTVIRSATKAGTVLTLTENVPFTGGVRVGGYDSHEPESAFDWYSYTAGTVDATNPFVVDLGAGHGLEPEDRVVVRYRSNAPRKTDVLAVDGPRVQLADAVTLTGDEVSVRIARVGASDPLGNADSTAMVEMGMGWMKWVFDPYGQVEPAVAPGDWTRWLLRVMRWLLGTQNFSLLPFGYVWWKRLFGLQKEHEAPIEQEASSESGDVYSPLGRLTGEVTHDADTYAQARTTVGDVLRYRFTPGDRSRTFVVRGRLDAPGVHFARNLRVMPTRASSGAATAPNGDTRVDPATPDPGTFVASPLSDRAADPRALATNGAATADVLGFRASALGEVPVGARLQRNESIYASFTRPGAHRVTTINGIQSGQDSVEADAAELQTLWFDLVVDDVTVTVAGRAVDDSAPGTSDLVTLVPFQVVDVVVAPGIPRTYRVAVLDPAGAVTVTGARVSALAQTTAPVPVEVSRHYAVTAGSYTGGLAFAGMHLARELDVPVRRLAVEVVATLPVRDAPRPDAGVVTTLAPGAEAFVLVPAPVVSPPVVTSVNGVPPAPTAPDPVTRVDAPDAAVFLGTGGAAFRVSFPAGTPAGPVTMAVTVGTPGASAVLTIAFTLG